MPVLGYYLRRTTDISPFNISSPNAVVCSFIERYIFIYIVYASLNLWMRLKYRISKDE
jgi:hypothetical protein